MTFDRRAFLTGAAASAGLLAAPSILRAQQAQQQRPRRIALSATGIASIDLTETGHPEYTALLGELRRLGYVEGTTASFERWGAAGIAEAEFPRLGERVAATRPDLIFVAGSRLGLAMKAAAGEIPIVFVASTPIEFGLVASLSKPGGTLTGFSSDAGTEIGAKRLQLLTQCNPAMKQVVWLGTPLLWSAPYTEALRAAAPKLGVELLPALVQGQVTAETIKAALKPFSARKNLGLFVPLAVDFNVQARAIAEVALANQWAACGESRELAAAGLLFSYGPDRLELLRGAAGYIDRILRGAKPADLPVQQPTKFDFVVNLKTTRALGIDLPLPLLGLVSEYIE